MFNSEMIADQDTALVVGHDNTEQAWVCSDRHVWYQNPFYTGEAMPHPEDDGAHDFIDHHGIEAWRKLRTDGLARLSHAPMLSITDALSESDCPF